MVKTGKAKVKIGKTSVKTGRKSVAAVEEDTTPPLSLPEGCLVSSERPSDTAASTLGATGRTSERGSDDDLVKLDYDSEDSDADDENRGEAKASGSSGVPGGSLVPGPCLQHCCGADVQLARGAGARPNLAKGKGRFLIVLPGMMSLKPPQSTSKDKSNSSKSLTQDSAPSVTLETMTSTLTQDTSDGGNEGDDTNNDAKPTATKPSIPTLGKIEKLGSDSPTLNIPFEDGRVLSFHGRKVESSSKFMALTCNSRKKTVTCKDIFSSVVVFGDAKWQNAGGINVVETTELSQSNADATDTPPLTHFGGSRRALDGGKNVGGSKKTPRLSSFKRKSGGLKGTPMADASEKIDVSSEEDEESDDDQVELLLNDDDEEEEEEYVDRSVVNDVLDGSSTRKRPSRRRASKSKVNYAELAGVDSEEDNDEDAEETVGVEEDAENDRSSSEDQAPAKAKTSRKPTSSRKRKQESGVHVLDDEESIGKDPAYEKTVSGTEATSRKRKQQSARKTTSRKRKQDSEDEEVFAMLRDDEEEDYVEGNVSVQDEHVKKKRASRRSASKRKVNYADLVEDEEAASDDDTDNVEEEEEHDGSNRKRAAPAKAKAMAKSTSRKRKQVTDLEVIEIDIEKENKDENTAKRPAPENGQTTRTSISRSRKQESDVEVVDMEGSENYRMKETEKATSARKMATRTKLASSSSEKAGCAAEPSDAIVLDGRKDDGLALGVENGQVNKAGNAVSPDRTSIGSWMGSAHKSPRRRRRATPNKTDDGSASTSAKSPVRRKLDISNDDEFDFLG